MLSLTEPYSAFKGSNMDITYTALQREKSCSDFLVPCSFCTSAGLLVEYLILPIIPFNFVYDMLELSDVPPAGKTSSPNSSFKSLELQERLFELQPDEYSKCLLSCRRRFCLPSPTRLTPSVNVRFLLTVSSGDRYDQTVQYQIFDAAEATIEKHEQEQNCGELCPEHQAIGSAQSRSDENGREGLQVILGCCGEETIWLVLVTPKCRQGLSLWACSICWHAKITKTTSTLMTPELYMQWKKKKFAEREACFAALAERASNDRLSDRQWQWHSICWHSINDLLLEKGLPLTIMEGLYIRRLLCSLDVFRGYGEASFYACPLEKDFQSFCKQPSDNPNRCLPQVVGVSKADIGQKGMWKKQQNKIEEDLAVNIMFRWDSVFNNATVDEHGDVC
ncbi:Zinc finger CCCH domain-containing protein 21, partial [Cucurbita argyrosperma subsp. sororia]